MSPFFLFPLGLLVLQYISVFSQTTRAATTTTSTKSNGAQSKFDYTPYLQPDDYDTRNYDNLIDRPDYLCLRPCENSKPKICYWKWTLEDYSTLTAACGNCTSRGVCQTPQAKECVIGDGYERTLQTVNRRLAGPSIQVCKGDIIVVDVLNKMAGRATTIHWHGIDQKLTPQMDGVPQVTQCPIVEDDLFRYKFLADEAGTYFWHSHDGFQKMDGIIGSLIIRQPKAQDPNSNLYDYDLPSHVVLITDWFHNTTGDEHWPGLVYHNTGQEPDTYLVNGNGSYQEGFNAPLAEYVVEQGKRYRFRFIGGTCLHCPFQVSIQSHNLTLIGMDKSFVEPITVNTFSQSAGERYDFVINAIQPISSYWIVIKGIGPCTASTRPYQLAILRYQGSKLKKPKKNPGYASYPYTTIFNEPNAECNPANKTSICISQLINKGTVAEEILEEQPEMRIFLGLNFNAYTNELLYRTNTYHRYYYPVADMPAFAAVINNISNVMPSSPPLTQYGDIPRSEFCPSECVNASEPFCLCTNIIKLPKNKVIELVIYDEGATGLTHPMHIHGYCYYVFAEGVFPTDIPIYESVAMLKKALESSNEPKKPLPPMKDTMPIPSGGYAILRIMTDNPGFWFFHCHFLYHHIAGMSNIFQVGELSDMVPTPEDFPTCENFYYNNKK